MIQITTGDLYVAPAVHCGRSRHAPERGTCLPGPRCDGCTGTGMRLLLEHATPLDQLTIIERSDAHPLEQTAIRPAGPYEIT
jgi:hypothetical protein